MKRPDNLKVGDKFVLQWSRMGIPKGDILTLVSGEGLACPLFTPKSGKCAFQNGPNNTPGCYMPFRGLKPYTEQEDQQVDLSKYQPDPSRLEVGKTYEFSCDGGSWFTDTFEDYRSDENSRYESAFGYWVYVREVAPDSLGKIAPEPLVEGQAYMFDGEGLDSDSVGILIGGVFTLNISGMPGVINPELCTNIRKLVPKE